MKGAIGMKALSRMIIMGLVVVLAAGSLAFEARAETRRLVSHVMITIRPEEPQLAKAPEDVQELYARGFDQMLNRNLLRVEKPAETGLTSPRYTITEKL